MNVSKRNDDLRKLLEYCLTIKNIKRCTSRMKEDGDIEYRWEYARGIIDLGVNISASFCLYMTKMITADEATYYFIQRCNDKTEWLKYEIRKLVSRIFNNYTADLSNEMIAALNGLENDRYFDESLDRYCTIKVD